MHTQRQLRHPAIPPVGIAGMGIRTAIGCSIPEFQKALFSGQQAFVSTEINCDFTLIHAPLAEFHFRQETAHYLHGQKAYSLTHRAPVSVQHSVLCSLEAWQQAADETERIPPERRGIIIGAQNINHAYMYEQFLNYQNRPQYIKPSHGIHFLDTFLMGALSEIFQIKGECFQTAAASATGNACIIQGMKQILSGAVDCCMVVGCMASLSPPDYIALRAIGALGGAGFDKNPGSACRPFDIHHNGFIPGEGCGCLILTKGNVKRLSGFLLSWGMAMDANASADPDGDGELRAMQQSLRQAGLIPEDIGYINAHGSASPLGDRTEAEALNRLLGNYAPEVRVNSTKSLVGHCLWSAGIVEAIATLIQLNAGQLHPTLNLNTPITADLNVVKNKSVLTDCQTGLSNSFGFGGINTSIVITKGLNNEQPGWH